MMTVKQPSISQKRLHILDEEEIKAFYGQPHFTEEERTHYFFLSPMEKQKLEHLHSVKSRIYFILQLGYFKACHLFFVLDFHEVEEDVRYIQEHFFPEFQCPDLKITKVTRLKQQQLILELCQYQNCNAAQRQQLKRKARHAAQVSSKPIYIFRELVHYLEEQRVVPPGYSFMQDTIGEALTQEQNRLTALIRNHLQDSDRQALHLLLEDSSGLYEITHLKHEPRDFRFGEIQREIRRGEQIRGLYDLASQVLPVLKISNESIKYYASLVNYYSVYKLKRFAESITDLYLLCFVYHRYQRIQDNLIETLIHHVRRYTDITKSAAKERIYESRLENNQNLSKAGLVLKLFADDRIAGDTPFREVQVQAFAILERQNLISLAEHIATNAPFDEAAFQWEQTDKLARQFKQHLRPILLTVDLAGSASQDPVMEAIHFLKAAFRKGKPLGSFSSDRFPLRCIPDTVKRYLLVPGCKDLLPDRYEFLVYRLLRNRLESGDIFCRDSVRFRRFEDDLLDNHRWQDKEILLSETGLSILKQPIQDHLADLEQTLENRIAEVNRHIVSGENTHIQIKKQGSQVRWVLQYPPGRESVNHPLFDTLKQMDIAGVLYFVNRHCSFLNAFDHRLGRYVKQEADEHRLAACLMAWGTNMGLGKMGEISDIGYPALAATSDNFLRLETLKEANDRINNATAKLAIFGHYDLGGTLHSSSDGQKFETRISTINARHSPKYFGLHKGIVAYTLVANHIPVNARIIGANEHESHYVFDLLFNNTTEIQPDVHSTDTHGTNEVNFALLHLFGYQFAPRYRDIYDKVNQSLYGFQHPSQYGDVLLKPIRKINTALIREEWENIQRIILSLALKTTTQSIIVGKLSAYERKNKTRRALWEYDNIIRSLYLLDYIDSPPLRQNVHRALNRGENYHQLRRAVSYANFGKLRFKTEYEQQIWGECGRLITNCIIYYNALILSNLLEHKEKIGDLEGAARLAQVSPVAWQHINLYGRYEFNHEPEIIDINSIVQELVKIPVPEAISD